MRNVTGLGSRILFEDIGAIRAQEDWQRYVGPLSNYRGDLGPRFSFMSVTIPECRPDRLEVVSYANEFAFMFDGGWIFRSAQVLRTLLILYVILDISTSLRRM
jgi:hypothetical protein